MQFIPGSNRHQSYFSTLEDHVSADNAVRLIDAFIDKLDILCHGTVSRTRHFLFVAGYKPPQQHKRLLLKYLLIQNQK